MKNQNKVIHFSLITCITVLLLDAITVVTCYYVMPIVQGFPPLSESLAFQNAVEKFNHVQQYSIAYCLGVFVHLFIFFLITRNIRRYLKKYYNNEKISEEEIRKVRIQCINAPYKIFIFQMILLNGIGLIFNFIMLVSAFAIIKFTLCFLVISSIISILMLIATQKLFSVVILTTYNISDKYERNLGYRITNSKNLLIQMIPFVGVVLIVLGLTGYSKAVLQEGYSHGNYYKVYLETSNISPDEVNLDNLKNVLNKIPLQSEEDYSFIITPNDEYIYTSNEDGYISNFVLKYRDFFYDQSNGFLFEAFGEDEQLYSMRMNDANGQTWYFGFKYSVIDQTLLMYYLRMIVVIMILFLIMLLIWSKNISSNLITTANKLKEISEGDDINNYNLLPIVSNDEFGDLAYYYNKIQELMVKNIEQVKSSQETLMERERLATLGQMVGGIAHNLKTPIMSIAGAMEGLQDLVSEYDKSIDDSEVTKEDHHAIASEMSTWINKVNSYDSYMSDIITAVKGQAVNFNDSTSEKFTIDELLKRVNILMRHELKNALVTLNVDCQISKDTVLTGNVNSLVQIVNNLISNAIQSYNGDPDKSIDLTICEKDNNIVISVKDYGCGIPEDVQSKLFNEMITTKGHNGTGLGLFMSYSTIKGHFNGSMDFTSTVGEGTTFNIVIPSTSIIK